MEQGAQTSAYLPRCRLTYSIGCSSVEINGSRLGRLTRPSDLCLMPSATCARSSAADRTHCYAIFRIVPALMIGALVLGGWLAGGQLAQAKGDTQRGSTARADYRDSLTLQAGLGRRRRKSKAHAPQGRKATCRHERRCAKRRDAPSQPAGGGSGGAPPSGTSSSSPPGESLTEALPAKGSPPLPAPPAEAPAKETPKGEPSGDLSYALRLFSAQSFFNQPLAASPQAPDSAQLVAAFNHQVQTYYGHVVINTTEWSAPVYTVPANAPTTAVVARNSSCPRGEGIFQPFAQDMSAVPIPAGAQAAKGTDEDMVVWQPSSGHEWELWRAQREDGQWTACWGGEPRTPTPAKACCPNRWVCRPRDSRSSPGRSTSKNCSGARSRMPSK